MRSLRALILGAALSAGLASAAVAQEETAPKAAPPPAEAAPPQAVPAEAPATAEAPAGVATSRKGYHGKDERRALRKARRLALKAAAEAAERQKADEAPPAAEAPSFPTDTMRTAALDAGIALDGGRLDSGVDLGTEGLIAAGATAEGAPKGNGLVHEIEAAEAAAHREHGKVAESEAVGEEHAGHAKFQVGPFIMQMVNFAGLLFILIYFGGRLFNKALRARHEQLKTEVTEAARLRDEAQQKAAAQEKRLAELEKEVAALRGTMKAEAEREQVRLIDSAAERAKRIQDEMRFQLDQQVKEAEMLLRAEVASASVKLAEELARKAVDTQDERRLAQEFVAGFGRPAGGER